MIAVISIVLVMLLILWIFRASPKSPTKKEPKQLVSLEDFIMEHGLVAHYRQMDVLSDIDRSLLIQFGSQYVIEIEAETVSLAESLGLYEIAQKAKNSAAIMRQIKENEIAAGAWILTKSEYLRLRKLGVAYAKKTSEIKKAMG